MGPKVRSSGGQLGGIFMGAHARGGWRQAIGSASAAGCLPRTVYSAGQKRPRGRGRSHAAKRHGGGSTNAAAGRDQPSSRSLGTWRVCSYVAPSRCFFVRHLRGQLQFLSAACPSHAHEPAESTSQWESLSCPGESRRTRQCSAAQTRLAGTYIASLRLPKLTERATAYMTEATRTLSKCAWTQADLHRANSPSPRGTYTTQSQPRRMLTAASTGILASYTPRGATGFVYSAWFYWLRLLRVVLLASNTPRGFTGEYSAWFSAELGPAATRVGFSA